MSLIRTKATITALTDLTPTAKLVQFKTEKPMTFLAGSFVNVFINKDNETFRRAYSLSNKGLDDTILEISVRRSIDGLMSPLFWDDKNIGLEVDLMGPLGINTSGKMKNPNLYLFAFGIGAGVVKALLETFMHDNNKQNITLMTGSRSVDEIVYRDFFNEAATTHPHIKVEHIISDKTEVSAYKKGYIQEHLAHLNFDNSDVFVCGQEVACNDLVDVVKSTNPTNCEFFVEGFH